MTYENRIGISAIAREYRGDWILPRERSRFLIERLFIERSVEAGKDFITHVVEELVYEAEAKIRSA